MPPAPRTECLVCGAGPITSGAVLCRGDLGILARDLADTPDVLADLTVTITRRSRTTPPSSRRGSAESPLPWSERASNAARHLTSVVLGAADDWAVPATDPATAAAGLRARITELKGWSEAGTFAEALRDAVADARTAVDLPRERAKFRVCPCPEVVADPADAARTIPCPGTVRAVIGAGDSPSELHCPSCRRVWGTHEWLKFGRRALASATA